MNRATCGLSAAALSRNGRASFCLPERRERPFEIARVLEGASEVVARRSGCILAGRALLRRRQDDKGLPPSDGRSHFAAIGSIEKSSHADVKTAM